MLLAKCELGGPFVENYSFKRKRNKIAPVYFVKQMSSDFKDRKDTKIVIYYNPPT